MNTTSTSNAVVMVTKSLSVIVSPPSTINTPNTRPKPRDEDSHDTIQSILTNTSNALEVAKDLAPLLPVPFVGEIFVSAKAIVDAAIRVRQNKLDCVDLAQKVANIARDVRKEIRGREHLVDESLKESLARLYNAISDIREFMEKEANRGLFSRMIHNASISARVAGFGAQLADSMATFMTTSNIRLEMKLEQVNKTVVQMDSRLAIMDNRAHEQRKWDGQHRIYRTSEIDYSTSVAHSRRLMYCSDSDSGNVTTVEVSEDLTRARIKGKAVVVRTYRGSQEMYRDSLIALKRARHNNIAQLQGYSDDSSGDDTVRFMVFKGKYQRLEDYMDSLDSGRNRYKLYIRGVMSTLSGHYYLASQGLIWLGRNRDTMIDTRSGEIVLGAMDDIIPYFPPIGSQTGTSPPAFSAFVDILPTLVQDWDKLRNRAAYTSRSYAPAFSNAAYSPSLTEAFSTTVANCSTTYPLDASQAAFQAICNWLIQRIMKDIFYTIAERSARTRTDFPPIGGICVLNPDNDDDAEDGQVAEDYSLLGMRDHGDSYWVWETGEMVVTQWMPDVETGPFKPDVEYDAKARLVSGVQDAMNSLARLGPAIALQRGVRLRNLAMVSELSQLVFCEWEPLKRPSPSPSPSPSTDNLPLVSVKNSNVPNSPPSSTLDLPIYEQTSVIRPVHFHTRTNEEHFEEPWGYFSYSTTPLSEDSPVPVVEDENAGPSWEWESEDEDEDDEDDDDEDDEDDDEEDEEDEEDEDDEDEEDEDDLEEITGNWYLKRYSSTLDGIRGSIWQHWEATFVQLQPDQADALEWIHKALSSSVPPEYRAMGHWNS